MDAPAFCKGNKGDCDCERFTPQAENRARCQECDHGISKHPGALGADEALQPPPSTQPPRPTQPSSATQSGPQNMRTVFQSVIGSSSNSRSDDFAFARKEALSSLKSAKQAGYGKLAKGPAPPSQKAHAQGSSRSSRANTLSGSVFRVRSLGMIVCGVDSAGGLRQPKAPFGKTMSSDIQALKNRLCFLDSSPYSIDSSWTHEQVTTQLRTWFPQVFEHLDKKASTLLCDKPLWRLLSKEGKNFSVIEIVRPCGSDLFANKGRQKAGVDDCQLWFATRSRIHDSVYDTWNTQYIVIGSNSDSERGSDMLPGTDSDEDANNELASSLVDLSLDLAVKRTPSAQLKKRARMILSSPESSSGQQAPCKKLRDGASQAVPLFLAPAVPKQSLVDVFADPPRSRSLVSRAPRVVMVSEDDMIFRDRLPSDDIDAPPQINPWDAMQYVITTMDLEAII